MNEIYQIYLGDLVEKQDVDGVLALGNTFKEAVKDFDKTLIKRLVKMSYEAECLGEKYTKLKQHETLLREKKKNLLAKEHNNGYVFITINPKPQVSLEEFDRQVRKAIGRNMFDGVCAVYEQRGTNEEEIGKGFHAHILAKRNLDYKPSKVANNLKNTFKSVCDVNNPALLNIQHIGEDFAQDKQDYILGIKTGEGKSIKQELDVVWRLKNDIKEYLGEKII